MSAIEAAREAYAQGIIDVGELEERLDRALRGAPEPTTLDVRPSRFSPAPEIPTASLDRACRSCGTAVFETYAQGLCRACWEASL